MVETQLSRGLEIVGNVIPQNLKGLTHLVACLGSGLGATAHIGVIEIRQTISLAPRLTVGTFTGPFTSGRGAPIRMSMRSIASGSRRVTRSELRRRRDFAVMPRRLAVDTKAKAASWFGHTISR